MAIALGRIGVWSGQLRRGDHAQGREAVAELEALGYGTVWMPGGTGPEFLALADEWLAATRQLVIASGILSVWTNPAREVAAAHAALSERYPGRFLLGLGVSHPHLVERQTGRRFEHPVAVMTDYLEELAATSAPVPREELVLAALGPRMLALSGDRTWGAHPYFVTPEHTRLARFVLGPGRLLAPEQAVVLESDPARARAIARRHVEFCLRPPTTRTTCGAWGLRRRTSPTRAATDSSTPSSPGETSRPSRAGSRSTWRQAPTTSACRS